MITVLTDRRRIEGPKTIDEAGLVDDLRGSLVLSGFDNFGRFNDPWGVEKGSGGVDSR